MKAVELPVDISVCVARLPQKEASTCPNTADPPRPLPPGVRRRRYRGIPRNVLFVGSVLLAVLLLIDEAGKETRAWLRAVFLARVREGS